MGVMIVSDKLRVEVSDSASAASCLRLTMVLKMSGSFHDDADIVKAYMESFAEWARL